MAQEAKAPSQDVRAHQEQVAAEWANVGLCGGMYRPAAGEQPGHHDREPEHNPPPRVNEAEWQPNNRCCV